MPVAAVAGVLAVAKARGFCHYSAAQIRPGSETSTPPPPPPPPLPLLSLRRRRRMC